MGLYIYTHIIKKIYIFIICSYVEIVNYQCFVTTLCGTSWCKKWRIFHKTFTQESEVCLPFETKHHWSVHKPMSDFVLRLNLTKYLSNFMEKLNPNNVNLVHLSWPIQQRFQRVLRGSGCAMIGLNVNKWQTGMRIGWHDWY